MLQYALGQFFKCLLLFEEFIHMHGKTFFFFLRKECKKKTPLLSCFDLKNDVIGRGPGQWAAHTQIV